MAHVKTPALQPIVADANVSIHEPVNIRGTGDVKAAEVRVHLEHLALVTVVTLFALLVVIHPEETGR